MSTVRERRLRSDCERLAALVSAQPTFGIELSQGEPPESYILVFQAASIIELKSSGPILGHQHRLKIELGAEYPAVPPLVTVLGPIWHPHVWPRNNIVCLGKWNITESLDSLVLRLHSLLVYELDQLNWKSVANEKAALWARDNQRLFPLRQAQATNGPSLWPQVQWHESA